MRVFVTGGTGLVGSRLVRALVARGDRPVVLSRRVREAVEQFGPKVEVAAGDPTTGGDWPAKVSGCDAVVHLAGESLFGKRWSAHQKEVIRTSRVDGTRNVVAAIAGAPERPKVLVSTSAVGFYGDVRDRELTESAAHGNDFLAQVCTAWENAALQAPEGVRVVVLRVGVVLAADGGALMQMLTPFKLGLGGPAAGGKQWVSWIHVDDLVRAYLEAIDNPNLAGPVNATAPHPVRNLDFSRCLARALHRPCAFPIPAFALKLRFGEVAVVVITGQKAMPAKLSRAGFTFRYATCDEAMADLFGKTRS
ncbi:MAG: TIGR01777 family protein [Planctomycetia bacterium]|nr:TIGR01777 family protein [Planctomycetia bacterium]